MRFRDRQDAGQQLAELIAERDLIDPVVLALPRGGVPVAVEVSRVLHAPLDVLVARKIGAPTQPELGIGAVAEGGVVVVRGAAVRPMRIDEHQFDRMRMSEERELERRTRQYRRGRPMIEVAARDVVLVDDGLATGVTAEAAIESLLRRRPRSVILAVPVAAADTAARLAPSVEALITVYEPMDFGAVGAYYDRFDQTTDAEVEAALEAAAKGLLE